MAQNHAPASQPTSQASFDIAVIGAGPAGAATAIASARAGPRVLLIDRGRRSSPTAGESLPPSAMVLLDRLGLRDAFLKTDPLPCYGNRSSWGSDGALRDYDFIRDRNGPGWQIDRRRFDAMLISAAAAAGASVLRETVVTSHSRLADGSWRLDLAGPLGPSGVNASLIVDASGRAATFARGQGVSRHQADHLLASVAVLRPKAGPERDSATLVEAVPAGWWYSASLPDVRLIAAYLTDPDLLVEQRAWTADGWTARLAATTHTRSRIERQRYELESAPRLAAAGSSCLERISGDGWLAVGDAAASFDPLSSHGIAAALSGGLRAAAAARAYAGGDGNALAVYGEQIACSYARYLWLWRAYYALENRWSDEPFWQRRQEPVRAL